MLELYHWEPNTCFLMPLIGLHEKQVGFTSHWFDPTAFEQFAAAFPKSAESGLTLEREGPVLVQNGAVLSGPFFILEYIAESFPAGLDLYPGDAFQHYRARAWGQVLGSIGADVSLLGCAKYLAPLLQMRPAADLAEHIQAIQPLERQQAWARVVQGRYDDRALAVIRERLRFSLGRLETALNGSPWLTGRAYSVADIAAFSLLVPLPELAPDVVNDENTPRINDFLRRMHDRKAVRDALAISRSGRPQEAFVPGAEPSRWG